jgi:hypothetical protein
MPGTAADNRKTLIFITAAAALLFLFWSPTFRTHFNGLDEIRTFIFFSRAHDTEELLTFFLTPHAQHLTPVFRAMFYIEYKFFGITPFPYHVVSIGLFILSAVLFRGFIKRATGDNYASNLCALAYVTNSAYFNVVTWVFAQQIILTFVFIELALLKIQARGDRLALTKAGAYCLLSSLCMSYGSAAWFICAIYLFSISHSPLSHMGELSWKSLKKYAPLPASAAITAILYGIFSIDVSAEYGGVLLNPLLYMHGIVIFIGNVVLNSLGIPSLAEAAGFSLYRGDARSVLYTILIHIAFIGAAFAGTAFFRRLRTDGRKLALASFLLALFSSLVIIAARANYYHMDIYELSRIKRYAFFPLAFLIIAAAPYIALLSRRSRSALFLLLPVWLLVHSFSIQKGVEHTESATRLIDTSVSLAKLSLDYPVEVDKNGQVLVTNILLKDSRPLPDFDAVPGYRISYPDMLSLFLTSNDLIWKKEGSTFLLRNSHRFSGDEVRAISPETESRWDGERLHISGRSDITLQFQMPQAHMGTLGHYVLSFKASAGQNGRGHVTCDNGLMVRPEEFLLTDGFFLKAHQVEMPCRTYSNAVITLERGEYTFEGIRLYW